MQKTKVYGCYNSGTNFLSRLLTENLEVCLLQGTSPNWVFLLANVAYHLTKWPTHSPFKDVYFNWFFPWTLGWKHTVVQPSRIARARANDVVFLTVTKNPYAWLLSMYRRPYKRVETSTCDFADFVERRWPSVGRANRSRVSQTLVDVWNEKNRSYLDLARSRPTEVLRYEDLLANPKRIMARVAQTHGIPSRDAFFTNVDESTKKSTKGDQKTYGDYRRYYLEKKWKKRLDTRSVARVNSKLDPAVVDAFGYDFIEA